MLSFMDHPGYLSHVDQRELPAGDGFSPTYDPFSELQDPAILSRVESTMEMSADYTAQLDQIHEDLASINYLLTAVLFLLAFTFCFNRIRNAVRRFTGRKLNE